MPIQSGKHCDDARCHSLMSNHVNSKHCLSPQIKKNAHGERKNSCFRQVKVSNFWRRNANCSSGNVDLVEQAYKSW